MKTIKGLIRFIDEENRIIEIKTTKKIEYLYLTKSIYNRFKIFLKENNFIEATTYEEFIIKDNKQLFEIIAFDKIIYISEKTTSILYDIKEIKKGIVDLLNKETNKMFIDLEFTMPEYGMHGTFKSQIIQYGFVIEDQKGNIIDQQSSLIKPNDLKNISQRTFEFINKDVKAFDDAIDYITFYQVLKEAIEKYKPSIIVWGSNDILMLDGFYKDNKLAPLTSRASFINIMQVIKNYFGIKYDIGLFKAKEFFSKDVEEQTHDAYSDARTTREVFHLFKDYASKK